MKQNSTICHRGFSSRWSQMTSLLIKATICNTTWKCTSVGIAIQSPLRSDTVLGCRTCTMWRWLKVGTTSQLWFSHQMQQRCLIVIAPDHQWLQISHRRYILYSLLKTCLCHTCMPLFMWSDQQGALSSHIATSSHACPVYSRVPVNREAWLGPGVSKEYC